MDFQGFHNPHSACHLICAIQVLKQYGFAHLSLRFYAHTYGVNIAKGGDPYTDLLKILAKTNKTLHNELLAVTRLKTVPYDWVLPQGSVWVMTLESGKEYVDFSRADVCILQACKKKHCMIIRKIGSEYYLLNDNKVHKMFKRGALKMMQKLAYLTHLH